MVRVNSDLFSMDNLIPSQVGGEDAYNNLVRQLDMIIMASVKDKDLETPPSSPSAGDCYFLGGTPTGDWSSNTGDLAQWFTDTPTAGEWIFANVPSGYLVYVEDEDQFYHMIGTTFTLGPS